MLQRSARIQHASRGAIEKRIVSACMCAIRCGEHHIPESKRHRNGSEKLVTGMGAGLLRNQRETTVSCLSARSPRPPRVRLQPAHVNCKKLQLPTQFAARFTNKCEIWEMHARYLWEKAFQMEWLHAIAGDMRGVVLLAECRIVESRTVLVCLASDHG